MGCSFSYSLDRAHSHSILSLSLWARNSVLLTFGKKRRKNKPSMVWAARIVYGSMLTSIGSKEYIWFPSAIPASRFMTILEPLMSLNQPSRSPTCCKIPSLPSYFPGLLFCPATTDSQHLLIYPIILQWYCQVWLKCSGFNFKK